MESTKKKAVFILSALSVLATLNFAAASEKDLRSAIFGTVVDAQSGDALPGVNVIIEGTTMGAATDLDGNYRIKNIPTGTYIIISSMIGYSRTRVENVALSTDKPLKLDFSLNVEALQGEEVVLEVEALRNSEVTLLKDRQKASAVSDAISAETMSKSGAGDAAAAMGRVTGASVVDGKYVYMRGLGERYGTTNLNGAEVPSPDPDKKAVQMDLFPSNLLDNIVTVKTATPDKPGNFAGGYVDIGTKSFPDYFSMSFSTSTSYNSNTSLQDGFLTTPDGAREVPALVADPDYKIPDLGSAFTNAEMATELDRATKAFNSVMSPTLKQAPVNQGYSFSIANQYELFGRPVGFISSVSYNNNHSAYNSGVSARYNLTGNVEQTKKLNNDFLLDDQSGSNELNWGGLANLAFKPGDNHELSVNFMMNHGEESSSRFMFGSFPRDLTGNATYETRVLRYVERDLKTLQFRGEHLLQAAGNTQIDWKVSIADSRQDEPDLRFFTDNYTIQERNGRIDTNYTIQRSIYPAPTRYFRELTEDNIDAKIDLTKPFKQWGGYPAKLKVGGAYLTKDRAFIERRFEIRQDAARYDGDALGFFQPENMGINEDRSTERFFRFNNYVIDATQLSSNYTGEQSVAAGYLMLDLPITQRLRMIGGARLETTSFDVVSQDSTKERGELSEKDILPSANFVYNLNNDMNLRLAYGRTLARPTFRELAPYASFEFVNDFIFVGNPNLQRTLIDNFDLRWETFSGVGEIYAISAYYKRFQNPIERVINPIAANPEVQYRNIDFATVYGAEFELRKNLEFLGGKFRNFQAGGNLSLVHSKVNIASDELEAIRAVDPEAPASRPLAGQSDYVFNANLSYDNLESSTSIGVYYNLFGDRLSEVSTGGTPDVYERARGLLDFVASQKVWRGLSLKFSAKNLLNSSVKKSHLFFAEEYIVSQYFRGRTFSFSTTYSID